MWGNISIAATSKKTFSQTLNEKRHRIKDNMKNVDKTVNTYTRNNLVRSTVSIYPSFMIIILITVNMLAALWIKYFVGPLVIKLVGPL